MRKLMKFGLIITIIASIAFTGCQIGEHLSKADYDVVVIGSDPEGIAAAIAAARQGLNTLLIDNREKVGGLFTLGGLNMLDMNYGPNMKHLTRGIFIEFFRKIGKKHSFVLEDAQIAFEDMLAAEENIEVKLNEQWKETLVEDNTLRAISFTNTETDEEHTIYAKTFIDATQNADIAESAGVPYMYGLEELNLKDRKQAVTLVFELSGIDWDKVSTALKSRGKKGFEAGATPDSAWGFHDEMHEYVPHNEGIGVRGLNIGKQSEDHVLINAMHLFGVDPLSNESVNEGRLRGIDELSYLVPYLRSTIPGFENASLSRAMDELYVRETRHMQTLHQLSIIDVLEYKDFWDKIAIASYPVDMQPTKAGESGRILGNPKQYSIPFRSIVPQDIDGLLVVGRCAGFGTLAHGSARVVPTGMSTGQAAGTACGYALTNNITFRKMSEDKGAIEWLQNELKQADCYLEDFDIPPAFDGSPYMEGIRFMLSHGLLMGGYENKPKLIVDQELVPHTSTITTEQYAVLLEELLIRMGRTADFEIPNSGTEMLTEKTARQVLEKVTNKSDETSADGSAPITAGKLCQLLYEYLGK